MTNTDSIYIPEKVISSLTEARERVRRLELTRRYLDEAELQGLRPDDAFCGVDAVALNEDAVDLILCFEVLDWDSATVRLTLARLVEDPDPESDDHTAEDVWSVTLVEVPWQLFSTILSDALRALANS